MLEESFMHDKHRQRIFTLICGYDGTGSTGKKKKKKKEKERTINSLNQIEL